METYLLSHQVAIILDVSVDTIRRYARTGRLKFTTDESQKIRLFSRSYIEEVAEKTPIKQPRGRPREKMNEK